MIGDVELVNFVPCPGCTREVGVMRRPRGRIMWYQPHRLERGKERLCRKSGMRLSPIDALAILAKGKK
jgi:hypothetical protein